MIKKILFFSFCLFISLYYFNYKGWIRITPAGWTKVSNVMQEGKVAVRNIAKKAIEISEQTEQSQSNH